MISDVYSCSVIQLGTGTAGCAALAFLFFAADWILHIAFYFFVSSFYNRFCNYVWWISLPMTAAVVFLHMTIIKKKNKIFGHRGHVIAAPASSTYFIHVLFTHGCNHMNLMNSCIYQLFYLFADMHGSFMLLQVMERTTKMQHQWEPHTQSLLPVEFTTLKWRLSAKGEMGMHMWLH